MSRVGAPRLKVRRKRLCRKLALRCLSNSLLDDGVRDTVTTKTVRHDCNRIAFDPGKVLAKRLCDVETDKGLITAEPKCGRDLFRFSKTSSGIRMLIELIGRGFSNRFFRRLFMLIDFSLFRRCGPGRNDADGSFLAHHRHHKEQSRALDVSNCSFSCFVLGGCVHQAEERSQASWKFTLCLRRLMAAFSEYIQRSARAAQARCPRRYAGLIWRPLDRGTSVLILRFHRSEKKNDERLVQGHSFRCWLGLIPWVVAVQRYFLWGSLSSSSVCAFSTV